MEVDWVNESYLKKNFVTLQEHQSPILAYVVKTNEINKHILLENCIYHTSNICELWCATNMRQQAGIVDMYHLSGRNRNNGEGKIKWMNNIGKHMKYKGGAYAGNKYVW